MARSSALASSSLCFASSRAALLAANSFSEASLRSCSASFFSLASMAFARASFAAACFFWAWRRISAVLAFRELHHAHVPHTSAQIVNRM